MHVSILFPPSYIINRKFYIINTMYFKISKSNYRLFKYSSRWKVTFFKWKQDASQTTCNLQTRRKKNCGTSKIKINNVLQKDRIKLTHAGDDDNFWLVITKRLIIHKTSDSISMLTSIPLCKLGFPSSPLYFECSYSSRPITCLILEDGPHRPHRRNP